MTSCMCEAHFDSTSGSNSCGSLDFWSILAELASAGSRFDSEEGTLLWGFGPGGVEHRPKEASDDSGSGLMSLQISSSKSPKLTSCSSSTLKLGSMPSSLPRTREPEVALRLSSSLTGEHCARLSLFYLSTPADRSVSYPDSVQVLKAMWITDERQ